MHTWWNYTKDRIHLVWVTSSKPQMGKCHGWGNDDIWCKLYLGVGVFKVQLNANDVQGQT
jgi:hypothetical protein